MEDANEREEIAFLSTSAADGRKHPVAAARLFRSLAMLVIERRQSKGYDATIAHLEAAKACCEKAGRVAEWERLVSILRTGHKRLPRIQTGLDAILAGRGPSKTPSFLEQAKARWNAIAPER